MTEIYERSCNLPVLRGHKQLIPYFEKEIANLLAKNEVPIRFVVNSTNSRHYLCDIGVMKTDKKIPSIFSFKQRKINRADQFNVVLMVPTGIGADIGGHAGDAGPVAKLFGAISDHIITHPNVVNASDINELPENGIYVEGSTLCRFLMGTIGLEKTRSNELIFAIDKYPDPSIVNAYLNAVNAARSTFGVKCDGVMQIDPPVKMLADYSEKGRAIGRISHLSGLIKQLDSRAGSFDAIAFATVIQCSDKIHDDYTKSHGEIVNPWGGVEAIFTHAFSLLYNVPCAHAPMASTEDLKDQYAFSGEVAVDPRMAGEMISTTFSQCIFKGLQKSPRIVSDPEAMQRPGILTVEDISCLVIPEGCIGLPVLAALEQGIPVIAVRENRNLMKNDLSKLPWRPSCYYLVENYWEAAGLIAALKAGIAPGSVRRPLNGVINS